MTEHEKRIRALLYYHINSQCELVAADKADLRALLADLDAVRGALGELVSLEADGKHAGESAIESWEKAIAALKGATHEPEPQDDDDNDDPWLSGDDMMGASG